MLTEWPAELQARLARYLDGQRWFAGPAPSTSEEIGVEVNRLLWSDGTARQLWQQLLAIGDSRYQLIFGVRPAGEAADFLNGHEPAVLGSTGDVYVYDALVDPELSKVLLGLASAGAEEATHVRPISAEQSNTSLVFDDRLVLKVFRRVWPGANPDVEITSALAEAGFAHVAAPLVHWSDLGYDLAFGQQFLAGGSDGWALALTSLRDLYGSPVGIDAGEAGGDFAGEAERLGRMTAEMHVTLQLVYGSLAASEAEAGWVAMVDTLAPRLERASQVAQRDYLEAAAPLLGHLRQIRDPGPAFRVHGDYHLGQVMRTDSGWYVLDFEGEPDRPVADRVKPTSPLKDVAGMLRSFNYASRHALVERSLPEQAERSQVASTWETHNRKAFIDGYRQYDDVATLLPGDEATLAGVLAGYELDKALYELDYELGHRPEWVAIPLEALTRLFGGGAGSA